MKNISKGKEKHRVLSLEINSVQNGDDLSLTLINLDSSLGFEPVFAMISQQSLYLCQ
jgi:hypothetical protein